MKRLDGAWAASVTPWRTGHGLDEEGIGRLVQHYTDSGLNGAFFPSSSGEYFALTHTQRVRCVKVAVDAANGRLPILANISEGSLAASLALAHDMADAGACAAALMPPSFHHHTQQELIQFFTLAADHSPLPLVIYNHMVRLPSKLDIPTVMALKEHPNIIGIKDTHNDAARLLALHARQVEDGGFSLLAGGDGMAGFSALLGMQMLNALCAVRPALFLELYEAGHAGDVARVSALQAHVQKLSGLFTAMRGGASSAPLFSQAIKAALSFEGLCGTDAVQLGEPLTADDLRAVEAVLAGV